jgi:hypothetical protein
MTFDMIMSATQFATLRQSEDPAEQARATHASAHVAVWHDVIEQHPDLRQWVAHNKTVPLSILALLAHDSDVHVRRVVAAKRKLDRGLFETLAVDPDEIVRNSIANNVKCPADIANLIRSTLGGAL